MALPFLPSDTIQSVFVEITVPGPNLTENQFVNFAKLKRYIQRRWINQVSSEELSIWNHGNLTNNGAESYHGRLKSIIKCNHPRIWNFLETLNEIIPDTDNELARLKSGLPITRPRKKKSLVNEEYRRKCNEKLLEGLFSPLEFLKAISSTVGSLAEIGTFDGSFDEEDEDDSIQTDASITESINANLCVVCLTTRETTWLFMPCKHANCCGNCSTQIEELRQACPTCRSVIQSSFQIFNWNNQQYFSNQSCFI